MKEINLLCQTTNDEQHGSETSPKETYQTVIWETLDVVEEAQVHLSDLPLNSLIFDVVVHHHIVDKCSRPDL